MPADPHLQMPVGLIANWSDGGGRRFAVASHATRPQFQLHAALGDVTVHPLAAHCGPPFDGRLR
jgi:hypothetical protein